MAPGTELGATVQIAELQWHAKSVPYYDYLLEEGCEAAILAGGHCIPVALPPADRMIWHKLYSSTRRRGAAEKSEKDLIQAVTLAALVVEQEGAVLTDSFKDAPQALRDSTFSRMPRIEALLVAHPQALDAFRALPRRG